MIKHRNHKALQKHHSHNTKRRLARLFLISKQTKTQKIYSESI